MDYRISTMTLVSEINTTISLLLLYKYCEINDIIRFIEFKDFPNKGVNEKLKKKKRKDKNEVKKTFYNQLTLHYFDNKIINVKIFNNGKIQMTGIVYEEQGRDILKYLIDLLLKLDSNLEKEDEGKLINNKNIDITKYQIVLINSDFDIGYNIDRDILHRHFINLGLYSSYEPSIYPGVNMKYFNNTINKTGVCNCKKMCRGKGNGIGDGNCKRITIAIFESGKILITGNINKKELDSKYEFIKNLMISNKDKFKLIDNSKS